MTDRDEECDRWTNTNGWQSSSANRTRLRAVAYRMLGSLSDADDAVRESWLNLSRSDPAGVKNLGGWADNGRCASVLGHVALPQVAA